MYTLRGSIDAIDITNEYTCIIITCVILEIDKQI